MNHTSFVQSRVFIVDKPEMFKKSFKKGKETLLDVSSTFQPSFRNLNFKQSSRKINMQKVKSFEK